MSSIFNKLKNSQIIIVISMALLFFWGTWTYNQEQKKLEDTSSRFVLQIEGLKGQVFLLNQLVTSIMSSHSKPEVLKNTDEIYSLDYDTFLRSNGATLNNRLYEIFSRDHSWLDASDLLYFKLFDSKTLLSDRVIEEFHLDPKKVERVFSDDYCHQYYVCARLSSQENLSDEFIFSNLHVSPNTNRKTLAIASPSIVDGVIVAESHIDVNLEEWESLAGMHITSNRDGENMYIRVSNKPYQSHFSWRKTAQIDNFVTVIFERDYGVLIAQGLFLALFAVTFNAVIMFYFIEKNKHSRTKLESMTDALTGCYNRKVLESLTLRSMMSEKTTNTVIAFDGNKIKFINDKYGHATGDMAIVTIAQAIKKSFRQDDIVVRTGGDEFVVIALGLDATLARYIVKDVNKYLARHPIIDKNVVSVSAGISKCKNFSSLKKAMSKADIELYANKNQRIVKKRSALVS